MERFMVNYTSKSVYKDLNDIVRYFFSFSHWKNKSSDFWYHFSMIGMRYIGGFTVFVLIQVMHVQGQVQTINDCIMYVIIGIPSILLLLVPKQCFVLIFYLFLGNELKNLSIIFFKSYFEILYPYGQVHKYVYSDLKKVVETEKIIKFYPGPYIVKKYLEPDSLNAMRDVLSCRLEKRYILDKKVIIPRKMEGTGHDF